MSNFKSGDEVRLTDAHLCSLPSNWEGRIVVLTTPYSGRRWWCYTQGERARDHVWVYTDCLRHLEGPW